MPPDPWVLDGPWPEVVLEDEWLWRRVRTADEQVTAALQSRGLQTLAVDARARENFILTARHLSAVRSLEAALDSHVREVTLIDAPPGYDVSHSEPRWPETIFISSPLESASSSSLRLLENVVHEGMHLQLTKFEQLRPLVSGGAGRLFSPWKREERNTQGVLHGVYVFACIVALFNHERLLDRLDDQGLAYAARRRSEIASELSEVNMGSLAANLSAAGRRFLRDVLSFSASVKRPISPR